MRGVGAAAVAITVCAIAAAGCGRGAPEGPGAEGRYLPLAVGASWTYRITRKDGSTAHKTTVVETEEQRAGERLFRVRTDKERGERTTTWEADTGAGVVVLREESRYGGRHGEERRQERWAPRKTRLDERPERLVPGTTWRERYEETRLFSSGVELPWIWAKTWTVEAVDEPVTVPAGTFRCLRLRVKGGAWLDPKKKIETAKTYWYAKGVGKVKEVGGQTEELVSFTR